MSEKIVVLNVSGIGDFVDSVPALRRLRAAKPDAAITLVVSEKVLPLAQPCPYVDEVRALPTGPGRSFPAPRDLPRWLGVARGLRGSFSASVHLYAISSRAGGWSTRLLTRWIGAPVSVGRRSGGKGDFFTDVVEDLDAKSDEVDAYLRVIERLAGTNAGPADKKLELWVPAEAAAKAKDWLESLSYWGALDGPLTLVALGGDRATRHEAPERADAWLSELQRRFKIRPILWGTDRDPGLPRGTRVVHADARRGFGLVEAAALFSRVDAAITTHSAPQHLAGVWGVPTVVLVGPGDPDRFRPHLPAQRLRLLRHAVSCAPCYFQDCPWTGRDFQKCLREIPADAIVAAFAAIIPAIEGRMV